MPEISLSSPPVTVRELQSHVPEHELLDPQFTATRIASESTSIVLESPVKLMSEITTPVPGVPSVSG